MLKWFKCVSLVLLITGTSFDFANAAAKKASSLVKSTKKELNAQIKQLKQNSEVKEYLSLTKKYNNAIKRSAKQSSSAEQMKSRIEELEENSDVKKFKELQEKKKQLDQKEKEKKAKRDTESSADKDKSEKKAKKNKKKSDEQSRLEELKQNADVQEYLKLQEQMEKEKKSTGTSTEVSKSSSKNGKNELQKNDDWRNAIATNATESSNIVEPVIIADKFEKSTLKVEKDVGQAPVKEIETPTLVADASDSKNTDPVEPQQKLFDEKVVLVPQTTDENVKKKIVDISNDLKNYHLVKNVNKQVKNSTSLGMELRKDLERYRQVFTNEAEKLANS